MMSGFTALWTEKRLSVISALSLCRDLCCDQWPVLGWEEWPALWPVLGDMCGCWMGVLRCSQGALGLGCHLSLLFLGWFSAHFWIRGVSVPFYCCVGVSLPLGLLMFVSVFGCFNIGRTLSVISPCWSEPCVLTEWPSWSCYLIETWFGQPCFLGSLSHPFTFSPRLSLGVKWASWKQLWSGPVF